MHRQVRRSFVHGHARRQALSCGIEQEHSALAVHCIQALPVGRDADMVDSGPVTHRLPSRAGSRPFPLIISKLRNSMRNARLDKSHVGLTGILIDDRAQTRPGLKPQIRLAQRGK